MGSDTDDGSGESLSYFSGPFVSPTARQFPAGVFCERYTCFEEGPPDSATRALRVVVVVPLGFAHSLMVAVMGALRSTDGLFYLPCLACKIIDDGEFARLITRRLQY